MFYLAADHLGSTSLALTTAGAVWGTRAYYTPWGAERGPAAGLPTDFTYTGQRASAGLKLVAMGARWLDTALGRWVSADTIVPSPANPQTLNRLSYGLNNPVKYIDPSGHCLDKVTDPTDGRERRETDSECMARLSRDYGIMFGTNVMTPWDRSDLYYIEQGLIAVKQLLSADVFNAVFHGLEFRKVAYWDQNSDEPSALGAHSYGENKNDANTITLRDKWYANGGYRDPRVTVIHEMWHQIQSWGSDHMYARPDETDYQANGLYAHAIGIPECHPRDNCEHDRIPAEALSIDGAAYTIATADGIPVLYNGNADYARTRYLFRFVHDLQYFVSPWAGLSN